MSGEGRAAAADDRGLLVFKLFPSLAYGKRMTLALGLVAAGLAVQVAGGARVFPGILLLAAGNLLLLVSGVHNKVDPGAYDPESEWVPTTRERLREIVAMDREIARWDRTPLEWSNPLGCFVFLVLLALFAGGGAFALAIRDLPHHLAGTAGAIAVAALDGLVLILPHWVTGTRGAKRVPAIVMKAGFVEHLLRALESDLEGAEVQVLCRLGKGMPEDLKVRVKPRNAPEGLLGMYGQVTVNVVQGTAYPFFYVVLVTRKDQGLRELGKTMSVPSGEMHAEFSASGDVDVLVVRNYTTSKSGYHTDREKAEAIFRKGLEELRRWAG